MNRLSTESLIAALAASPEPVRPLPPPLRRAAAALAALLVIGATLVLLFGSPEAIDAQHARAGGLIWFELAAMAATGLLAVAAAFAVSIPGRSRRWLLAPLPAFVLWVSLAGLGCWRDFIRRGAGGGELGESAECLTFIVAAGLLIGIPLLWLLSRARPIDPLPVALLGGLGAAALSALLLVFFHPFAVTLVDLAAHLLGVGIVVAAAAALRRRALEPV